MASFWDALMGNQGQQGQVAGGGGNRFLQDLLAGGLIAYGNDNNIAPVMAMQERRRTRQEQLAEKQAEQERINKTVEYFKAKDPEIAGALETGAIDGNTAMRMWYEKQKGQEAPTPYTDIAKAKRDLDAGYLTPEQYQQIVAGGMGGGQDEFAKRAQAAAQFGLDPNSPAYQSYVLTGRMPREDQSPLTATDKKAILEADDMVSQNESAVRSLEDAKGLSEKANSGFMAGTRAWLGNTLPDMMVPDFISSPESSKATAEMDNVIFNQALNSMKAIFGGNPTEGERAILLELQAASTMPKPVRDQVLRRAQEMAQRRLEFNRQRASGLRGGEYYQPGGADQTAPSAAQPAPGQPVEVRSEQEALSMPPGTIVILNGRRFKVE
jgi:hypothetical protein